MDLPVDPQVQRNVERLELGFDVHGIDPFGVSKKALVHFYSVFASVYRRYLRVTTFGMEHIRRAAGPCSSATTRAASERMRRW